MRILVADEQAKVRFALRVLLGQQTGLEIVGETTNAGDLVALTRAARPDVVLLHWSLQDLAGVDLLPALRRVLPDLCVIVLSARPEARRAALDAGADAFVSKVEPPELLLAAIRSARRVEDGAASGLRMHSMRLIPQANPQCGG